MKKYSKYGEFKKIIHDFDMFKSPANLRIKQEPDASQYCSGIFSILLFGFFIFVLVTQFKLVFNYESIKTQRTTESQPNLDLAVASNFLFAFSPAWQNYDTWSHLFQVEAKLITQTTINQTQFAQQQIQLQRCQKEKWENFSQIYTDYDFQENICVKNPAQLQIKGTNQLGNISYLSITLKRCNESTNKMNATCWDEESFINNLKFLEAKEFNYYSFYIIDTSISADKQNPINQRVRLNYDLYYSKKMREDISLYLGTYSVETDESLLPYEKTQVLEGYYVNEKKKQLVDKEIESALQKEQIFGDAIVLMTNKRQKFKRKIGKIDEVISYAGGLFGILISCFAFIINSYNQYSYELTVAESSFNYDEHGNQIKQRKFNFFKYIKFTIYDWVKFLFCYEINWRYDRQKDETREQSNATMDVINLYRKIQLIQIILGYICDKNELTLDNLTKPLTLKQIQQKRLGMEYYHQIIQGKVAINVEDLIKTNQSLQEYKRMQQVKNNQKKLIKYIALLGELNSSRKMKPKDNFNLSADQQMKSQDYFRKTSSIELNQANMEGTNELKNNISLDRINQITTEAIKQQTRIKFEKYSGIQNSQIIKKISQYTEIAEQAKKVKLQQQMQIIQQQFAEAYLSLSPIIKNKIVDKIPLKILHRLVNCISKKQKKTLKNSIQSQNILKQIVD